MANFDPLAGYEERYGPSNPPYYYKARIPQRGTPLRNATLAKAMSLQVRYPLFLAKGIQNLVGNVKNYNIPKQSNKYGSSGWGNPVVKFPTFSDTPPQSEPIIFNVSGLIKIYLTDEYNLINDGSQPYVVLDYVPDKIETKAKSELADVGVVGLNLPHLHYGGSRESVSFTIDWIDFATNPGFKDRLITKCEKLKALTKADGFNSGPKTIFIDWAGSAMFKYKTYLVESADYTTSQFSLHRKAHLDSVKFNHLNPIYATQQVILREIGDQLTYKQMINNSIQISYP